MRLIKADCADFDRIYPAMCESFIPEEIRDEKEARAVLGEKNYTAYKIYENDVWVGFITLWELSDFAFVEHFVIFSEFRGRGLGAKCLKEVKGMYEKLVLEAEPPIDEIQKRRIGFYNRCGFFANDYPYIQPSYREGGVGVTLLLMSYPRPLCNCDSVKNELYKEVYKVK